MAESTCRRELVRLAMTMATLVLLAIAASPAHAATSHVFKASFGASTSIPSNPYPLSGPTDVAVHESNHSVWVTDPPKRRIEKFDSAGNFVLMVGGGVNQTTGANVCTAASGDTCVAGTAGSGAGSFQTPAMIAVDNSSSSSNGAVYVADTTNQIVQKFDSSGQIVGNWGSAGQVDGLEFEVGGGGCGCPFGPLRGLDVGPDGVLYVFNENNLALWEYTPSGTILGRTGIGAPLGFQATLVLAIDTAGNAYAESLGRVRKFVNEGEYNFQELGILTSTPPVTGFAIDLADDGLYQSDGTEIHHYSPDCDPTKGICSPVDSFGSGTLSAAKGVAVDASTGDVFAVDSGPKDVISFRDVRPLAETKPPSDAHEDGVTLNGHVDPIGRGDLVECRFEYGFDKSYGQSAPCVPDPASSPPGSHFTGPTDVEAELTGLSGGTSNHYRVVVTNEAGATTAGKDETFITTAAPAINGLASANLTATTADLQAKVNPNGLETHYRFEYGQTPSYGQVLPVPDGVLAASNADQAIEVHLVDLTPGLVYHYRLVAENENGVTQAPDHTFNFYPPSCPNENVRQQVQANYLPDCRAYELVSPGDAAGTQLYPGGPNTGRATSPSRLAFTGTFGTIPGSGSSPIVGAGDLYIATRTPTGWASRYVGLPSDRAAVVGGPPMGLPGSAEGPLGTGLHVNLTSGGLGSEDTIQNNVFTDPGMNDFLSWDAGNQSGQGESNRAPIGSNAPYVYRADGSFRDRWPTNLGTVPEGVNPHIDQSGNDTLIAPGGAHALDCPRVWGTKFTDAEIYNHCPGDVTASSDLSNFVFATKWNVFAPGGTLSGPGSVYDNDTNQETVVVASKLANGENISSEPTNHSEDPLQLPAVSADGSHILMASGAVGGCGFAVCSVPACDVFPGPDVRCPMRPSHLYMRVDGAITYDVSGGYAVDFEGATSDGSKVYFSSPDRLTPEDLDTSRDLYIWTESSDSIQLVSVGANGSGNSDSCNASYTAKCGTVTYTDNSYCSLSSGEGGNCRSDSAVAAESGDFYFLSPELLDGSRGVPGRENLYVYRNGGAHFVAAMTTGGFCHESEFPGYANSACTETPVVRIQVTPDGDYMAFVTASPATQYDSAGYPEMYLYESTTGALTCVSCVPSGAPPTSDVQGSQNGLFLTDDGRPFFSTEDALVSGDTNQALDVYEYVDGRPQLITPGTGETRRPRVETLGAVNSQPGLVGVSADGTDVYFSTYDTLVPQDHNGLFLKFYDARTGGGFAAPPPPLPCEAADECHAAGNPTPPALIEGTGASLAGGNAAPASKQVKKGGKRHSRKHSKRKKRGGRHKAREDRRNRGGSR
jgi:hypothetical protein